MTMFYIYLDTTTIFVILKKSKISFPVSNTPDVKKEKNQCPREGMFPGSFAKARGRDEE